MNEQQVLSEEQRTEWVRGQFQKANKYLAENGILFDSVVTTDSRYIAPHLAIWKIKATDGKKFWVVSGEVPTDMVKADVASSARGSLKHFSLHWQVRAEGIFHSGSVDTTQQEYAKVLVSSAEYLYGISEQQELWDPQG